MSQVVQHNNGKDGYWFAALGSVYDAAEFLEKHPDGMTVIALCSGQDATHSLVAVAHLSSPGLRSLFGKYRTGTVEKPDHCEELYASGVRLGEKAAETENVARRSLQLLQGDMTASGYLGRLDSTKSPAHR